MNTKDSQIKAILEVAERNEQNCLGIEDFKKMLSESLGYKVGWDTKNKTYHNGFDCSYELRHLYSGTFPGLLALKFGANR